MRQIHETCDSTIIWNVINRCDECERNESSNNENRKSQEIVNGVEVERRRNKMREVRTRRRKRCSEIKVKRGVKNENKGATRLFSLHCNSFGPGSNDKIDQVIKESKGRDIDGIMINSLDAIWETVNKKNRK